jgi:threonine dehydrogenase-like Zn-dependent dehydrogenase
VLGDGKLGLLCAQVLWLHTKRLLCIGKHPWKLDLLKDLHISIAHTGDPVERGADFVIEVTGTTEGLRRALELVRPEGTIVLKTTCAQPTTVELSGPVVSEVKIIGSRCGPFRPALDALTMGNVEVRPMISETYELKDAVHALERASSPDVIKVLIHV